MSCVSCGARTPNRKCAECLMIDRVDEHFQADRNDRDTEEEDEAIITDGGEPALDADAEIHVSHAAREGSLRLLLRACDISGPSRERAFIDEIDSIEELVDYHAEYGEFTSIYGVGPAKNRKLCAAVEMISKTPEESGTIVTDGGVEEMPAPVYETKTVRVHEPDRGQYIFLMLTRFDGLQQPLFAEIGYTSTYIQFATMGSGSHNRDADTDPFAIARRRDDDFTDTNAFRLMYALDTAQLEWSAIEDGDRLTEEDVQALVIREDEVPDAIVTDGGEESKPIGPEQFEDAIAALQDATDTIGVLREELKSIDTGLTRSDTVALLYGRRNDLNKTEIKNALETLDDISSTRSSTLVKRLLADLGGLNQSTAESFLTELERLEQRYGGDEK